MPSCSLRPSLLPLFHDILLVYSKQSFDGVALVNTSLSLVQTAERRGAGFCTPLSVSVSRYSFITEREENQPKGSECSYFRNGMALRDSHSHRQRPPQAGPSGIICTLCLWSRPRSDIKLPNSGTHQVVCWVRLTLIWIFHPPCPHDLSAQSLSA